MPSRNTPTNRCELLRKLLGGSQIVAVSGGAEIPPPSPAGFACEKDSQTLASLASPRWRLPVLSAERFVRGIVKRTKSRIGRRRGFRAAKFLYAAFFSLSSVSQFSTTRPTVGDGCAMLALLTRWRRTGSNRWRWRIPIRCFRAVYSVFDARQIVDRCATDERRVVARLRRPCFVPSDFFEGDAVCVVRLRRLKPASGKPCA